MLKPLYTLLPDKHVQHITISTSFGSIWLSCN